MTKVSVIIPVYNVEDYLSECLESVINQTYRELEILCIDDCSADRSLEILQEYARRDARVIISENQENCGQAYTRNKGLELATGDYILFVDSDDTVCMDLVESCVRVSEGCDMVCFDYKQLLDTETYPRQFEYHMEDGLYTGEDFFAASINKESIIFAPWSRLYSRRFLEDNNITFHSGLIYEDVLFSFYCYVYAKKIYSLNRKLYEYRIRSNSTMTKNITGKSIESYFICICELTQFYLQTDFGQEVSRAVEKYIRKVCRDYISTYRKWEAGKLETKFLKDKPEYWKLYQTFSKLLVSHGKISDISPRQIEKIRQHQNVILYGAGDIARSTIEILDRYDISLCGIAVSNGHKKRKSLLGNPIKELWEYREIKENCLVLIGTIPRYFVEIRKQLQENGFFNWMEVIQEYGDEENGR